MSEIWRNAPLRDFCSFISGSGFPEHLQGRDNGDLPFYKVSDMSSLGNERFLLNANNYVSRELARKRGWKTAPANAVVFAKVGAAILLNRRRVLSIESIIDNNMVAVVANQFTTNEWLYWQLLRVDFADFVQDGALPSINQRQLGEIPIPKVNASEALKISEILDTLDTTIRETEAIIAKLKAVKQGLLHDLLTRGIDANGELRPPQSEARHLYKDSPLGWIPKEWKTYALSEVSIRITDGTHQAVSTVGRDVSSIPFLFVSCIRENKIDWEKSAFVTNGDYLRITKGREPKPGMVLYTAVGSYGYAAEVIEQRDFAFQRHIACIFPRWNRLVPGFMPLVLNSEPIRAHADRVALGNAQKTVTLGELGKFPFICPSPAEQLEIVNHISTISEKLNYEIDLVEKLSKEKNGLMDDLLTGRVRVTPLLQTE